MNWHEEIRNGDIVLKPIGLDDAYWIMGFANDEVVRGKFNFFREPITLEKEIEYIRKIKESSNDTIFVIERIRRRDLLSEESLTIFEPIGTIGFHDIDWASKSARLGVIIWNKECRGRGYRTKALKMLIDYFFSGDILHKIYVNLFESNLKEIDFYQEKFGFKPEARLEKYYRFGDESVDMVRLSLAREGGPKCL